MTEGETRKFEILRKRFIEWLECCNYAVRTLEEYDREVKQFIKWLSTETEIINVNEILPMHISHYQLYLYGIGEKKEGKKLSISTQAKMLAVIRTWFEWLVSEQQILFNPALSVQKPRVPQVLPRNILTTLEVQLLLESTPIEKSLDIRDRAILEILYGSGIRRDELRKLSVYDIDLEVKTLRVESGKGGASRIVPLTLMSVNALKIYVEEVRSKWISNESGSALFISGNTGRMLCSKAIEYIVKKAGKRAGLSKKLSPHILRHSCATHLLQSDADIRYIQRLLGHRKLSTTEIYTQVEISDLQRVIEKYHPREKGTQNESESTDS